MRRRRARIWVWALGCVLTALVASAGHCWAAPPNPGLFISQSTCSDILLPATGLTFCFDSVSHLPYVWNGSAWIPISVAGGGVTAFGNQGSGTQTCASTSAVCSVTLTSSNVTLDSAPPAITSTTQLTLWQVTQDATGGRVPTWGPHMHFSGNYGGIPGSPLVPLTGANVTEQSIWAWNPVLAKWDYQARGGMQLVAPSNQGGNNSLGLGNGNGASITPSTAPANIKTQVASDNGGFFTSQGGGVAFYDYMAWGEYTLCNPNSSTEFFSAYCDYTSNLQRMDSDHEIDGGECIDVPLFTVNSNLSGSTQFASFHCFVIPTNTMTILWHSYFTEEMPVN